MEIKKLDIMKDDIKHVNPSIIKIEAICDEIENQLRLKTNLGVIEAKNALRGRMNQEKPEHFTEEQWNEWKKTAEILMNI